MTAAEISWQSFRPQAAGREPVARFYRPELDCLRLGAFLLVFIGHVIIVDNQTPHVLAVMKASGKLGVPLFFVLSAYLITELLVREKSARGTLDLRAFYLRRSLRIWPLYFFALAVGYVLLHRAAGVPQISPFALAAFSAFAGNWYTAFFGFLPAGMGPLWSISVEEQFYLIWPAIVRVAGRRRLIFTCAGGWLVSQIAVIVLCWLHAPIWPMIWTNSFTHLQYFALGAILCLVFREIRVPLNTWYRAGVIALGLTILFGANVFFNTDTMSSDISVARTWPGYAFAGFGCALLLFGCAGAKLSQKMRPFVWLGKISYGLYVYHVPCVLLSLAVYAEVFHIRRPLVGSEETVVGITFGLPITIAVAAISYRYLEAPFLRLKQRFEIVKSRAV
jgi:peptidoglycan/LPS O-acetylase OafA/YrhL